MPCEVVLETDLLKLTDLEVSGTGLPVYVPLEWCARWRLRSARVRRAFVDECSRRCTPCGVAVALTLIIITGPRPGAKGIRRRAHRILGAGTQADPRRQLEHLCVSRQVHSLVIVCLSDALSTSGNRGTFLADILVEQASRPCKLVVSTSLSPQAAASLPLQSSAFVPLAAASSTIEMCACFVLRLTPAVVMAAETACQLSHLVGIPRPQCQSPIPMSDSGMWLHETVEDPGTLQAMLLARAGLQNGATKALRVHNGQSFQQHWTLGGRGHRGVVVSRIPFTHLTVRGLAH